MKEQTFLVETPDGKMETFLAMPDGDGPYPSVVLFMDIWGMREQLRNITRFVAAEGFACAAPSLYYRWGNNHFDYRHADGSTKSIFTLSEDDRQQMLDYGSQLTDDMATSDTAASLVAAGIPVERVNKVSEGRPHIVDRIKNNDIDFIINTTQGEQAMTDSGVIRRSALMQGVCYVTTLAGGEAATRALRHRDQLSVTSLQELHS